MQLCILSHVGFLCVHLETWQSNCPLERTLSILAESWTSKTFYWNPKKMHFAKEYKVWVYTCAWWTKSALGRDRWYSLVIHAEDIIQVILLGFIFNQRLHLPEMQTFGVILPQTSVTHCGSLLWSCKYHTCVHLPVSVCHTNLMAAQLQQNGFEETPRPFTDITHFSLLFVAFTLLNQSWTTLFCFKPSTSILIRIIVRTKLWWWWDSMDQSRCDGVPSSNHQTTGR